MKLLPVALVVAGCWQSRRPEPVVSSRASGPDSAFVISARGAGPFDAATVATLPALQKRVPNLRVVPNDLGGESGVVYDIFDGNERLYYVVPDDAPGWTDEAGDEHRYAYTMFAVFAVSSRITVEGRSWRVGAPFTEVGDLERCECWGNSEVTACYRRGRHVRVIFEARCDDAERDGPRAMLGQPIGRIMWKRRTDDLEPDPDVSPGE